MMGYFRSSAPADFSLFGGLSGNWVNKMVLSEAIILESEQVSLPQWPFICLSFCLWPFKGLSRLWYTVETAYKVYVCSRSTLYADLLNSRPKVTIKVHIGALIYLLYKWFYSITGYFISGFYCSVLFSYHMRQMVAMLVYHFLIIGVMLEAMGIKSCLVTLNCWQSQEANISLVLPLHWVDRARDLAGVVVDGRVLLSGEGRWGHGLLHWITWIYKEATAVTFEIESTDRWHYRSIWS